MFSKWRLLTSIIFLYLSLLFWEGEKDVKQKKWKGKHLGEDNEWKPTWAWCFLNYLLAGKWVWLCIFLWVSKQGSIHQIVFCILQLCNSATRTWFRNIFFPSLPLCEFFSRFFSLTYITYNNDNNQDDKVFPPVTHFYRRS